MAVFQGSQQDSLKKMTSVLLTQQHRDPIIIDEESITNRNLKKKKNKDVKMDKCRVEALCEK